MAEDIPGIQTEIVPAVPLHRWVDGVAHHYFTIGSEQGGEAGGYRLERTAGNVPLQQVPGTLPVQCYLSANGEYNLTTSATPPAPEGWTKVNQTPWYVFDPTLAPPPGAVPMNCYTIDSGDGTRYFYSADPEIEDLDGWTTSGVLGYIFKVAMPVRRWSDGEYHFLSTDPNAAAPSGFSPEGTKFFAFTNPSPQTVPVYSYKGLSPNNVQDQFLDVVANHARPGWSQDPGQAFYAFPSDKSLFGATPLQHYQSEDSNFFTADPHSENLTGLVYCNNVAQVFPVTAGDMPPAVTLNMTLGTIQGETTRDAVETGYIDCEATWYGLLFTLSRQATTDVSNGANVAAAVSAAVAGAMSLSLPPAAALIAGVSGYLWAVGSGIGLFDRGNGVYIRVPWYVILDTAIPALILASILPWPR
jgi:hypothetical protein